jgi:hypothetical protein
MFVQRGVDGHPRPLIAGNQQPFPDAGIGQLLLHGVGQVEQLR